MSAVHAQTGRPARSASRPTLLGLVSCLALLAVAAGSTVWAQGGPLPQSIADKCRADLAARLKLPTSQITVSAQRPVLWPDASLGLPRPGEVYAQRLTPGWSLYLRARGTDYLYTAGVSAIRYGGPAAIWSVSLLRVEPKPNDPNLNGTLVQLSPLGTNRTPILEEVTSFYPQENGSLFATRRTSRSGFDLLYLAPGARQAQVVASALDFGPVALSSDGDQWAAFIRPGLGQPLALTIRSLRAPKSKGELYPLPSGISGAALHWDGDTAVATVNEVDGKSLYRLLEENGVRTWKKSPFLRSEVGGSILLNKSESLVVESRDIDGKPVAHVYTQWFTGDQRDLVLVRNMRLERADLSEGCRYVVLSGRIDDKPTIVVVDYVTHEAMTLSGPEFAGARMWLSPVRSVPSRPVLKPSE